MKNVNEMLTYLFPELKDGVEYKKLGEIAKRLRGTSITATTMKKIASEEGEIKVFAGGKTVINAHLKDIPNANIITVPSVLCQSRGVIDFVYYDKPFTFKNEMWAYTLDNTISVKYIYYVLKHNVMYFRDKATAMGAFPQISIPDTEKFEIPVPPIEVQSKIVEILDNFTELEIKLEAELEARRKQYEYYRNQLLTFDLPAGEVGLPDGKAGKDKGARFDVKWMKLGEVCEVTDYVANGSFASLRENVQYKNEPDFALLVRTVDLSQNFNGDKVYINEHAYNFLSKSSLHGGEIIINNIGAGVGQTFRCPYRNEPMSLGPNSIIVKTPNNDFYYHWFNSFYGQKAMSEIITPGALPKFNKTGFKSILIPIPPLEEQKRIVSILDRFEALTTDLQSGLPAEIEARRKQYEYYREKLLTFKRKTA